MAKYVECLRVHFYERDVPLGCAVAAKCNASESVVGSTVHHAKPMQSPLTPSAQIDNNLPSHGCLAACQHLTHARTPSDSDNDSDSGSDSRLQVLHTHIRAYNMTS